MKSVDNGLEVLDLWNDPAFAARRLRPRDNSRLTIGLERLAHALVEDPDSILQKLADTAIELCGADSAGISLELADYNENAYYKWVATAGGYRPFLDALLPRFPSACGICLERDTPQLLRVSKRFFDLMQIEAAVVTDGLLIPWHVNGTRGTIWIMAHGRTEAFDPDDLELMQLLARFAALGVSLRQRQTVLNHQWAATAASAIADTLARRIHKPLQELSDIVFLAGSGKNDVDAKALATQLSRPLHHLSQVVEESLGRTVSAHVN